MVIAIDGPAGVGKSTISKMIAEKTDFIYINSGNFYRGITYFLLKNNIDISNEKLCIEASKNIKFYLHDDRYFINDEEVNSKIHNDLIDKNVSKVSSYIEIRDIVNNYLKKSASDKNIIVEGRDMTTIVFKDAKIKFYLDASIDERSKRRYNQGTSKLNINNVKENIIERDNSDKNKKYGKLEIANDAVYLDTTHLTIDQVCEKVIQIINAETAREQ